MPCSTTQGAFLSDNALPPPKTPTRNGLKTTSTCSVHGKANPYNDQNKVTMNNDHQMGRRNKC